MKTEASRKVRHESDFNLQKDSDSSCARLDEIGMKHDLVFPYGDRLNDGIVQVSFTLPIESGALADEAARQTMKLMGLNQPQVAVAEQLYQNATFFVGYGKLSRPVELSKLKMVDLKWQPLERDVINREVEQKLGRRIAIVGASTGQDAHTVGLDAILNYKGFAGNRGLESYSAFHVVNMGSQVPNEEVIAKAREVSADAILVSQVVTQSDVHLANLTNMVELLEAESLRDEIVLVVGGPRITYALAIELGYDAGFGTGTKPQDVASYLSQEIIKRKFA